MEVREETAALSAVPFYHPDYVGLIKCSRRIMKTNSLVHIPTFESEILCEIYGNVMLEQYSCNTQN